MELIEIPSEFSGLLMISDAHFDSAHCDRELLKSALDYAISENLAICSFGDWFDAMQGKSDKRGHKQGVRPENNVDDYLGSLVTETVNFLKPYAGNVAVFGYGNHETSILKHSELDLISATCAALGIQSGGYAGFVRFRDSLMYYHHGHGGGGEATRGTIQASRRSVYVPDADILVSGHIHEAWMLVTQQVRVVGSETVLRKQWHVSLPTFKQEYNLAGGYHLEKGRPPKPLGYGILRNGKVDLIIK